MKNPFSQAKAAAASGDVPPAAAPEQEGTGSEPRGPLPFHPFLFAAFPLLALFAHNMGQVPLRQLGHPLGVALLGMLGAWAFFLLLTRRVRKAALAASAVVLTYFSYGHVAGVLPPSLRGLTLPLCAVCLLVLLALALRGSGAKREATTILNVVSLALIAPSCWTISAYQWQQAHSARSSSGDTINASAREDSTEPTAISPPRLFPAKAPDLPDVYYVILDAYGRADRFKLFYDYDNTPFLHALEQRGFYIPPRSRANYDQTQLCLSSALNMNYLNALPQPLTPESLRLAVDDNPVAAYLRKLGYRYVSIWSGLELSRVMTADAVLNNQPDVTRFEAQALTMTPYGARGAIYHERYDRHRERIRGVFDNLETVSHLPSPKFVFAHVLCPHPPFVFGSNGEPLDPVGPLTFDDASELLKHYTRLEYKRNYVAQLQYVNRRVLQAVDAILRQSRRPPIIILQGDHGSRMNLEWESLADTNLREPFSIFNAYLVPPKIRNGLYDTITPVNSFRVVLTRAFGANYARLPDRSYYSTAEKPYDFTDVTDLIESSQGKGAEGLTPNPPAPRISPANEGRPGVVR